MLFSSTVLLKVLFSGKPWEPAGAGAAKPDLAARLNGRTAATWNYTIINGQNKKNFSRYSKSSFSSSSALVAAGQTV
jgi:hypothetical protein